MYVGSSLNLPVKFSQVHFRKSLAQTSEATYIHTCTYFGEFSAKQPQCFISAASIIAAIVWQKIFKRDIIGNEET